MQQFGRYQIISELGRGGMAMVYLGHDPRIQREVAIKVLPRQFTHDPRFLERFRQEARTIAALEHYAIVPIYDFGEEDDAPYLVMRYMSGGSLRGRLDEQLLPLKETSQIMQRLASAMDMAHGRGIIHRDLKPGNVLFDSDNQPYLADFGIARLAEATQTMTVIGTPSYMSPEQVQGQQKLDWRSDIYALGVMLFEMLAGRQPYEAETPTGQMFMHVMEPVPDILTLNPDLTPEAQTVINRAMAKDRESRYQTAEALSQAVQQLVIAPPATVEAPDPLPIPVAPQSEAVLVTEPLPTEPILDDYSDETIVDSAHVVPAAAAAAIKPDAIPDSAEPVAAEPASSAQTSPTPSSAAPPAKPPKKRGGIPSWVWWVGAVVIIAPLIVGLYAMSRGGDDQSETEADLLAASLATEQATQPLDEDSPPTEAAAEPTSDKWPIVVPIVAPTDEEPPANSGPVTLSLNWGENREYINLDPIYAANLVDDDLVNNLFMSLTRLDPLSGEVLPSLAKSWEANEDGTFYTFHLRDDVPWVRFDPASGELMAEIDENGRPRMVTAADVIYGMKRSLDPETEDHFNYVLFDIVNAEEISDGDEGITLDDLGAELVDDWTVQFFLKDPAPYFPSILALPVSKPQPEWLIEQVGDDWTAVERIVTNGPYGLQQFDETRLSLVKNPLWPDADQVQIELIEGGFETAESALAMYENNELDTAVVPLSEFERIRQDPVLGEEWVSAPIRCTYYYGFINNKAPFDDVRVRTAFVQAIDRQALIDDVLKGAQTPASSLVPPGAFGAVQPGTVGLPYDTAAAQASLQQYLDEKGLSLADFNALDITLMHNTSESHGKIAQGIQQMWLENLGVNVIVEDHEFVDYLDLIDRDSPHADAPHIYRLGWCADYADANDWLHTEFNTRVALNRARRNCPDEFCSQEGVTEFDELTFAALQERDPEIRSEIYAQAERVLAVDEAAYAPLYHYTRPTVIKPGVSRSFTIFGGEQFWTWSLAEGSEGSDSEAAQGDCSREDILCVGMVTDVGEIGDKSFNQAAWEGAELAASEIGAQIEYIETKNIQDYDTNITLFADNGYDVIVTVGFAMGDATAAAAAKYPDIDFIGVDQYQGEPTGNLVGLIFNEDKAGFIAGALAGMLTESNTIAAVLGTDLVPPVVAFKQGFENGAEYINPGVYIISTYHPGGIDVAFTDPEWGASTAKQAMEQGADVVFAAGGVTGNGGLIEVAGTEGAFCIGVDTDQWETVPEARSCLVSSAMKLITPGVFDLIEMSTRDAFPGGNFFGLTGLAPFHDFDGDISQAIKDKLAEIDAGLQDGSIETGY